jgi:signal transduction histidine kinase
MKAKLTLRGKPRKLPPDWETNLLRISQEALTNAMRHAGATRFDTVLVFGSQDIRVSFRDNGRGFDPDKTNGGFGIRGIRERVQEMGGKFSIKTTEGKGTLSSIVLPSNMDSQVKKL